MFPSGKAARGAAHRGPRLGALVHAELVTHGVDVATLTTVKRLSRVPEGAAGHLRVGGASNDGWPYSRDVDLVLVSVGVRPDTDLLVRAGAQTAPGAQWSSMNRCAPVWLTSTPPAARPATPGASAPRW